MEEIVCSVFPGFIGSIFLKALQAGSNIEERCCNMEEWGLKGRVCCVEAGTV